MTELPDLPPLPRRTRPLPDGGLDAVMSGGRRRRQRALAVAGGATTALAVVIAGVVALPGGSDELSIDQTFASPSPSVTPAAPPEEQPESPPPAPVPTVLATDVPGLPSGAPAAPPAAQGPATGPLPGVPTPRGGADAGSGDGRQPTPGAREQPGQSGGGTGGPTAAPAPPPSARPAYVEDTDEDAEGGSCMVPRNIPGGSCGYGGGGREVVKRGEQVQTVEGICDSADSAYERVFFFDDGQEKEVVVTGEGLVEVFRFSSTVRYVQGAHERRLRPGRCIQWTGRWDLVTTDGKPVPAGDYEMTLTVEVDRSQYAGMEEGRSTRESKVRITVVD